MTIHYDDIGINEDILLDLPMTEGIGTILHDVATPARLVTLVAAPTWTALASGLMTLNFDGATQYGQCLNANCADLKFTAGDYSILCAFNWASGGDDSAIIMGRYQLDVGGWELYLYTTGALTLRHHHAGTLVPLVTGNPRSAAYSMGWAYNTNWVMGLSRVGSDVVMYRNGEPLTMFASVGGVIDPEATTYDLVIGARFTKDDNFIKNMLYRPRIIGAALTAAQHKTAYELIKGWL